MFIVGKTYRRRDLHHCYGGQQQGGISTPAGHPLILLFTGESGEQHGYADGWTPEGIFRYIGEGQVGDMTFVRGNAAIRNHVADGKDLHLFAQAQSGFVRYLGQMVCTGHTLQPGPDRLGHTRQQIVFELTPLGALGDSATAAADPGGALDQLSLAVLRARALAQASTTATVREQRTLTYQRSAAIRLYTLRRAQGCCEGCGQAAPFHTPHHEPYLEVHHIRRISDGGPDHPAWVVALCPNCHRRAHHSADASAFNAQLRATALSAEA
jgi:5-methylcytosine-specific restriction enzyme A